MLVFVTQASQLTANAGCFSHFKPCIILWDNVKACPQKGSFQVSSNTVLLEGTRFLRSQSFSFLVNKNVNILPTMRDQCLYPREEKSSSCSPHFCRKTMWGKGYSFIPYVINEKIKCCMFLRSTWAHINKILKT